MKKRDLSRKNPAAQKSPFLSRFEPTPSRRNSGYDLSALVELEQESSTYGSTAYLARGLNLPPAPQGSKQPQKPCRTRVRMYDRIMSDTSILVA